MAEEPSQDVKEEVEQTTPQESSPEETNDQEQIQSEESTEEQSSEAQEESGGQETTDEGTGKKRDAQSRIQQLIRENKELKGQGSQQMNPQQARNYQQMSQQQQNDFANYVEQTYGGNLTHEKLNQAMADYAQQVINPVIDQRLQQRDQQAQQQQAYSTLTQDVESVQQIDELNPESENYDPDLEERVSRRYEAEAQVVRGPNGEVIWSNPQVRLKDIAKDELDFISKYKTKGAASGEEAVNKQKGETAIRPGGGSSSGPDDSQLSAKDFAAKHGLNVR